MHVVETILWKSIPWPGHESARLLELDDGWELEGAATFLNDGQPCRLDYTIDCDPQWHTRRADVYGWIGNRAIDVIIEVTNGVWTMNGVEQPQVADCIDIDLNFSPSTNLLPIRRQATEVRAAWLRFPSFELQVLEQRYTRLAEDRVRYESFTTNFSAELRVSPNGLVIDYENIWMAEG